MMSHPQGTEDFSVEAADLAGSIVQSQYLGVAVAVAIVGYLPSEESCLLWRHLTGKLNKLNNNCSSWLIFDSSNILKKQYMQKWLYELRVMGSWKDPTQ